MLSAEFSIGQSLGLAVFIFWAFALVNLVLNLALLHRLRPNGATSGPLVSVIIPARDEERMIGTTVRAMLAQTYDNLEVIVVDDRSTDATTSILDAIAGDDERLRVIRGEETPDGWLGKPWALHQGATRAGGELLLFVDADIIYAPGAVAAAVDYLQSSGAGMVALMPHLELRGFWEHVAMPQLAMIAYVMLPTWLSNRTTLRRLGIGGGPGNLLRREAYERAGGHESLKDAVIDDVGMARLLRSHGIRTHTVRAEDLVSMRMYRGGREIVQGFTKNTFAAFDRSYVITLLVAIGGVVFSVWPYAGAAMGSVVSIATVVLITVARLILFAATGLNLIAAIFAYPLSVLLWTWMSLRSMWITGVRRQLAWRGRTYDASRTRFGSRR